MVMLPMMSWIPIRIVESSKVSVTRDGTTRMVWEPNSDTRIRFESHPEGMNPGIS